MVELIEANWILLVIALVIGVLVAWWVFVSSRRTKVEIEAQDAAEDAPRTKRNQALIDAAPAASTSSSPVPTASTSDAQRVATGSERVIPPAVPMGLAGVGEVVQAEAAAAPEGRVIPDGKAVEAPASAPSSEAVTEDTTGDIMIDRGDSDEALVESTLHIPADPAIPLADPHPTDSALTPSSDDLTRIKGLGPKIQVRLHELGVVSFAQIADWDETEIDRIDAQLDRFQGRIRRDNWVDQARMLSSGDTAAYEERFGKL